MVWLVGKVHHAKGHGCLIFEGHSGISLEQKEKEKKLIFITWLVGGLYNPQVLTEWAKWVLGTPWKRREPVSSPATGKSAADPPTSQGSLKMVS